MEGDALDISGKMRKAIRSVSRMTSDECVGRANLLADSFHLPPSASQTCVAILIAGSSKHPDQFQQSRRYPETRPTLVEKWYGQDDACEERHLIDLC